eukprot:TRINITY_DN4737_c0_g1_i8.p3 TRINITY_DN4737_c0_g1~~TRINITY_DN4737_c0_g1_i8.p3  ORF type:complete len:254 (+),score=99.46 TRINITY_DN4737_c0_g1_i8:1451-2212(+)
MQHCPPKQRQLLVNKIAPYVVSFACNTYGSHGVQKLLEFLNNEQIQQFTDTVKPNIMTLLKDAKGNYLLQSFLKTFNRAQVQFIYDYMCEHCNEIATHKVGCTVMSRCIDFASDEQLTQLMKVVIAHALELVEDQYGNYVIQHVLHQSKYTREVIGALLDHIPKLCAQKFSSNVIETCLHEADPLYFDRIVQEITSCNNLHHLLQDQYGNFVIQTALDAAKPEQHAALVKQILPYIHEIKTPYMMHIQKKILQ